MRLVALMLALVTSGCLATGDPHNPMEKKSDVAPVSSQKAPAAAPEPEMRPTPVLPTLTRVQAMKEIFLKRQASLQEQKALQERFMRLANDLSVEELKELNEFLSPFGVQLHRKCQNPDHHHSEANPDDRREDQRREVY